MDVEKKPPVGSLILSIKWVNVSLGLPWNVGDFTMYRLLTVKSLYFRLTEVKPNPGQDSTLHVWCLGTPVRTTTGAPWNGHEYRDEPKKRTGEGGHGKKKRKNSWINRLMNMYLGTVSWMKSFWTNSIPQYRMFIINNSWITYIRFVIQCNKYT